MRDATGTAAIADDTGLEVAALGGRPGVLPRYAGPSAIAADNIARLLEELDGMTNRSARFRTVVVAVLPDGKEIVAEGILTRWPARRAGRLNRRGRHLRWHFSHGHPCRSASRSLSAGSAGGSTLGMIRSRIGGGRCDGAVWRS